MHFDHDDHDRVRARELAAATVAGSLAERDRTGRWDRAIWRALGAAGLLGIGLPIEHGGGGRSAVALVDSLIGLAEGSHDAGLAQAWVAHAAGCGVAIGQFGAADRRRRYIPGLASGELVGAFADVELDERGTTAQAHRSGWRLDGGKTQIVNGPIADLFVVSANLEGKGPALFLIERDTPGLVIGERWQTVGLRTATIGELRLDGCELGPEALLGTGAAPATIRRWQRVARLAPWIGLLDELVRVAEARARGRSQSVRATLADMRIRVELCRRTQLRAAWRLDRGGERQDRELAVASALVGDTLATLPHEAANVFASFGSDSSEDPILRFARDAAVVTRLWEGPERARAAVAATLFDFSRI